MSKLATLIMLNGNLANSEIEIKRTSIQLGRSGDNDVIIDDHLVSRHHAHITFEEGNYYLADLDTPNGTYINQQRIRNQKLHSGDVIQIGTHLYRFVMDSKFQSIVETGISPPQQEKIKANGPAKKRPLRYMVWGSGLMLCFMVLWIALQPTPAPKSENNGSRHIAEASPEFKDSHIPPTVDDASYLSNQEKANRFFDSGYREYNAQNFFRALDDFKTALEFYPNHVLAKIYYQKTETLISSETDKHYKAGINYFNSGQYQLAVYHFRKVMELLDRKKPSETVCSIKEEKEIVSENSNYEKYCDSEKKITQAQELLSK